MRFPSCPAAFPVVIDIAFHGRLAPPEPAQASRTSAVNIRRIGRFTADVS